MIALGRFWIVGLLVLSIVYIVWLLRLRAKKRDALEEDWHEDGRQGEMDDYVDLGLRKSQKLRRWSLFALVYGVPICIVLTIVYLTNFH